MIKTLQYMVPRVQIDFRQTKINKGGNHVRNTIVTEIF